MSRFLQFRRRALEGAQRVHIAGQGVEGLAGVKTDSPYGSIEYTMGFFSPIEQCLCSASVPNYVHPFCPSVLRARALHLELRPRFFDLKVRLYTHERCIERVYLSRNPMVQM